MGELITRRARFGRAASRNAKFPDTIQRVRSFGVPIQRTAGYFSEVAAPGSATYFDEVQTQLGAANIVAHYRLDETTGTTAADATGSYDGTYVNGPTLGSASLLTTGGGTAVDFDGVNDFVDLGAKTRFDFVHQTGVFTVSVWAVIDSASGGLRGIAGNTSAANTFGHLVFVNYTASLVRFGLYVDPVENIIDSAIPADGAHLFTLTGDGTTLRAYIDATEVGSKSFTPDGGGNTSTQGPAIARIGSSFPFDGRIDETFYANVTATPAQIAALYAYGTA